MAHPILSLPSEFFRFTGIILKHDLMGLTLSFYFYLSSSYPWLLVSKLRSSPGLKETSLDYKQALMTSPGTLSSSFCWFESDFLLEILLVCDWFPFSWFLFLFFFCLFSKTACHHLHQYSPPIEEKAWFFISCFPWTFKPRYAECVQQPTNCHQTLA